MKALFVLFIISVLLFAPACTQTNDSAGSAAPSKSANADPENGDRDRSGNEKIEISGTVEEEPAGKPWLLDIEPDDAPTVTIIESWFPRGDSADIQTIEIRRDLMNAIPEENRSESGTKAHYVVHIKYSRDFVGTYSNGGGAAYRIIANISAYDVATAGKADIEKEILGDNPPESISSQQDEYYAPPPPVREIDDYILAMIERGVLGKALKGVA
jgi:hypothetical protein